MRRLFALLALIAVAATPALASDPSSGKVSKASPKVTWSGTVTSFQSWQLYNQGNGQCIKPSCDTFTLEVADGPAPLKLTVESTDSTMIVEVVAPDGTKTQFGGEGKTTSTIKNAANGTYTINVAQNESTTGTHKGTAELVFPAPQSGPLPAPSATPAPETRGPLPDAPTLSLKPARLKKNKLPVKVTASAPVSSVQAVVLRGKKVVARASATRIERTAVLTFKFKGKPKRGRYTLRVQGVDEYGRTVAKTASVKI
jgi:hypothetical protein